MDDAAITLESLVKETHKPETEIRELALRVGLRELWKAHILGRYVKGQMARTEAVAQVGVEAVELSERQHQAILEDLTWAADT